MTDTEARETILIVDDAVDLINLLEEVLRPLGYQIMRAHNGRDGLKLALMTNPDLIMLDMHMPLMNGLEMLEALRGVGKQVPIIFMTRFGSAEMAVKAFRLGVYHYLSKPFDLDEVRQTVADALLQNRLKREREALQHNLIAAETVRQTVVTLAHHINNQLMVVQTSLSLLTEMLLSEETAQRREELLAMIVNGQQAADRITAVLTVLQQVTSVEPTEYYQATQMLDITAALEKELNKREEPAPDCSSRL